MMSYPPSDDLLPFHLFDTHPELSPAPTYDSPGLSHEYTSTSTSTDVPDLNRPNSMEQRNGISRIPSLPLTPAMRGILSATMSPSIFSSPSMSTISFGNISSPAITNKRQQQRRQSLIALSFEGLNNQSSRRPSDDDRRRSLDDNDVDDYVHEHTQYVADDEIQATWTEPSQPVLDPTQVEAHNQLSSMYDDAMQQFQRSPQATQLKSLPSFANPNPTDTSPPSSTPMSLTPLQVNTGIALTHSLRPLVHQLQHQQWKQHLTRSQRDIETSTIRRSTRLQQKSSLQPEASPMGSIRSVEQTDDETSVGEKDADGETPPTTPAPDDTQTQNESDQLSSTLSSQLRIPQHATPAQPKRTAVTKLMAQNLPTIPGFASPPIHPPPNKRNRGSSLISPPVKGEAFVVPSRQMVTSMQNELNALRQALKEEQAKVAALEHAARNPSIYDAVSWTLYRSMFVRSPMLMYCLDMHRRCVDANDVFLSRHGWSREEIQGKHIPPANGPTPASILAGHLINQQLVAPNEIAPLKAGLPSSLSPTDLLPNPVTITSLHALLTQQQSHVTVTERMVNGHGELVEIDWHYWVLIDTSNIPIYLIGEASQHHIRTLISHHTTPNTTTTTSPTTLTSPLTQTTSQHYNYDQHQHTHSHTHTDSRSHDPQQHSQHQHSHPHPHPHQDPHSHSSHADPHQHQHPPQHQSHSHDHIPSSHSHSHSHSDITHPQFHPDTNEHSHYLQS